MQFPNLEVSNNSRLVDMLSKSMNQPTAFQRVSVPTDFLNQNFSNPMCLSLASK